MVGWFFDKMPVGIQNANGGELLKKKVRHNTISVNHFIVTSQFAIVCFCVFIFNIHSHGSEI
jgi:hypothetical protein